MEAGLGVFERCVVGHWVHHQEAAGHRLAVFNLINCQGMANIYNDLHIIFVTIINNN